MKTPPFLIADRLPKAPDKYDPIQENEFRRRLELMLRRSSDAVVALTPPVPTSFGILGNKPFLLIQQAGFNNTASVWGCNAVVFGAVLSGVWSEATYGQSIQFARYQAAAAANADGGIRQPTGNTRFSRGGSAGRGGFQMRMQLEFVTVAAGAKGFFGVRNDAGSSPLGLSVPSALPNICGIGFDAGDANIQILHNDGAGTATKIDTGLVKTTFVGRTIDLWIECAPAASALTLTLYEVTSNGRVTLLNKVLSTNIPASNIFLDFLCDLNSAASGVINEFRFHRIYGESQ